MARARKEFDPRSLIIPVAGVLAFSLAVIAISLGATPDEAPFLAENSDAMKKMMADMDITPSGDIDNDFVAMMVPHHQGAIEMAQALLRHGHNERLKRLAQEIIVTQREEIAAMRLALGKALPTSASDPMPPPVHEHQEYAK